MVITTVWENRLTLMTIVALNLLKVNAATHCHQFNFSLSSVLLKGHGESGDNSPIALDAQLGRMLFVTEHACL